MGKKLSKIEKSERKFMVHARKERSRLVWVSYGIFIAVLPFADD